MSDRVNMKFVAILAGALIVLAGGVMGVAYFAIKKSGADYETLGDNALAEGNIKDARDFYSRAVNHDPTNLVWLEKWIGAIEQTAPETRRAYEKMYNEQYLEALRQIAVVARNDVQRHDRYLSELYGRLRYAPNVRGLHTQLATQVEDALSRFESDTSGPQRKLRRYRGLSRVMMVGSGMEVTAGERDEAREDLLEALDVDSADSEAAVALASLITAGIDEARQLGRVEQAEGMLEEAMDVLSEFIRKNPGDALTTATRLQLELGLEEIRRISGRSGSDRLEALRSMRGYARPFVDELVEQLRSDQVSITAEVLNRLVLMERAVREPGSGYSAVDLADSVIAEKPDDAEFRFFRAGLAVESGDLEAAEEDVDALLVMEPKPMSLEGLLLFDMKRSALLQKADIKVRRWSEASREDRPAIADEVRAIRSDLDDELPEGSPPLLLLDAKLAIIDNDLNEAQRYLEEYKGQLGTGNQRGLLEAVSMLANVAQQRGQLGTARSNYQEWLSLNPTNVPAMIQLAAIEAQLENVDRAEDLLRGALEIDPGNTAAAEVMTRLMQLRGMEQSDDPVQQALIDARLALRGTSEEPGDAAAAIQVLRSVFESLDYDPRLTRELAQLLLSEDESEEAIRVVQLGLERSPDDEGLRRLERALTAEDSVGEIIAMLDESDLTEVDRELRKHRVLAGAGRYEESVAALDRALAASPDDTSLIEFAFVNAVSAGDVPRAEQLAETAKRLDADGLGGLTFTARLGMMQGDSRGAAASLREAIDLSPSSAPLRRLHAQALMSLNRGDAALAEYAQALEIAPNDLSTIVEYITALTRLGRNEQALAEAREQERIARSNPTFRDLWINLEGLVGDKDFALAQRERILETRPENRANKFNLARLYSQLGRWADAKAVIDDLSSDGVDLQIVALLASWHADQGDLEQADQVFVDHILEQDLEEGGLTAAPYLAYGGFMLQRGEIRKGLTALEQGRQYQDPELLEADRTLAEALLERGMFDEAVDPLERIVESDDDDSLAKLRLAETLTRLERFDDARTVLDQIPADAREQSVSVMLLEAETLRGEGDTSGALTVLDDAAARFSEEPMVYVQRARILGQDEPTQRDALDDLENALRLSPGNIQALQLRAGLLGTMGRVDEAIEDLRTAIAEDPRQTTLRDALLIQLLDLDRDAQAVQVAREAIDASPGDILLIMRMGGVFRFRELHRRATELYALAWEQSKQIDIAVIYVDSLLKQQPQDLRTARAVLQELEDDPNVDVDNEPRLLLTRAWIFAERGDTRSAARDVRVAYRVLQERPGDVFNWFSSLGRVYNDDTDRIRSFLERLRDQERADGGNADWPEFFLARMRGEDDPSGSVRDLLDLAERSRTPRVRLISLNTAGAMYYVEEDFDRAAQAWAVAAEQFPNDWESANNLAYILATELDRAAEAESLAERAVQQNPDEASTYDTLGIVYEQLGRMEDAERAFRAGLSRSDRMNGAAIAVHLARVLLEQGDEAEARSIASNIRTFVTDNEMTAWPYMEDLESLEAKIASLD